jgi:hypothetical protein
MAVAIDDLSAFGWSGQRPQVLPVCTRLQVRALDHLKIDEAGLDPCRPDPEDDGPNKEPRSEYRPPPEMRGSADGARPGSTALAAGVAFGSAAGLLFCHRSS